MYIFEARLCDIIMFLVWLLKRVILGGSLEFALMNSTVLLINLFLIFVVWKKRVCSIYINDVIYINKYNIVSILVTLIQVCTWYVDMFMYTCK